MNISQRLHERISQNLLNSFDIIVCTYIVQIGSNGDYEQAEFEH